MKIQNFKELQEASLALISEFKSLCESEHSNIIVQNQIDVDVFYIGLLIKNAPIDEPDLIELCVDARVPPGLSLEVVWGDGNGTIEADFSTNDLSEHSFTAVYQQLPGFLEVLLKAALRGGIRRHPRYWEQRKESSSLKPEKINED